MGWVAKLLISEKFNNLKLMEDVKCPVMFIHGMKDTLIPKEHAEDLHAKVENIS